MEGWTVCEWYTCIYTHMYDYSHTYMYVCLWIFFLSLFFLFFFNFLPSFLFLHLSLCVSVCLYQHTLFQIMAVDPIMYHIRCISIISFSCFCGSTHYDLKSKLSQFTTTLSSSHSLPRETNPLFMSFLAPLSTEPKTCLQKPSPVEVFREVWPSLAPFAARRGRRGRGCVGGSGGQDDEGGDLGGGPRGAGRGGEDQQTDFGGPLVLQG